MEGEGSSEGESDRKRGGADDGKIAVSTEGQSKPKRQMKTPFQLETLEKAYACKFFNFINWVLFCVNFDFFCCNC